MGLHSRLAQSKHSAFDNILSSFDIFPVNRLAHPTLAAFSDESNFGHPTIRTLNCRMWRDHMFDARRILVPAILVVLSGGTWVSAADETPERGLSVLLPLDNTEGITESYGRSDAKRFMKIASGEGDAVDAKGVLHFGATTATADGSHYFSIKVPLPAPTDLSKKRLVFRARTNHPGVTAAFYVRAYNKGQNKPAWSFNSWNAVLTEEWREVCLQQGFSLGGLTWEPNVVEDRVAAAIDRIEFIIGTREDNTPIDILLGSVKLGAKLGSFQDLETPHPQHMDTVLVQDGQALVSILHADSAAGRQAALQVATAIADRTGVTPAVRPGTKADRIPEQATILLGNVNDNPAMLLLYARYFTPADSICPGTGGSLVHTVFDPFGKSANVIVAGASDDTGLVHAAHVLAETIAQQAKARSLVLPRLFEKHYGESFLKRHGWADDAPAKGRLEQGVKQGQEALDRGRHTSIAGILRSVAERYMLTGHSVEAKLFVALWDLYAESAVADPRKYGGPWGFDSDFPSAQVVAGWDIIEEDPILTDDDRLRTTRNMGRWLTEAVIPKCAGAARSTRVPHNHQTFPGLGALFAGLYFSQHYDVVEGRLWLAIADAMFKRQAGYFKPHEDCNGYQWLTNGHLMRYCLVRPDFTLFDNGNGARIVDYCMGTMDNLGYQVPYGDTGSWKCWNSEMICLDMYAYATGSAETRWAANQKRALKKTSETHAFYQLEPGTRPDRFNGVTVWPLEPQYYRSHSAGERPALERCFDKISFREAMDSKAAYLLLDGLSNGGHKHLDGNSLPRLTLFDRIWLADNDYYKAPVKFHNSVTVFRDGQSAAIPPYTELISAGESPLFGYSKTKLTNYAGVDWTRTIFWLKRQQAFAVVDQLTALSDQEYQFRTLWHGVGDATLSDDGLLLTQKGPSLWIQMSPGPVLELHDDLELGANWSGYAHAAPVVRSLEAVSTVKLNEGETHLVASVLHGKADGVAEPWDINALADGDGFKLVTPEGEFGVVLGPHAGPTPHGRFESDAECLVISRAGLSLLDATYARVDTEELFNSAKSDCVDLDIPEAPDALHNVRLRGPVANISVATDAPSHQIRWCVRPKPTGPEDSATNVPSWRFTRLAKASLSGTGEIDTLLAATADGTLFALNRDGTTRWSVETGTQLNDVVADDLTGDGKGEIIVARHDYHVQVLNAAGEEIWRRALSYYRKPPHVNLVRTGDIDGDGTPEVIAGGENWRFYAFRADGTELWNYESVHPSRSGAVCDLDGDGKAEVICGTHYYWASVLNAEGHRSWQYRFGPICYDIATGRFDKNKTRGVVFGSGDGKIHYVDAGGKQRMAYDTGDEVKQVTTGDLDGDGLDEILAGSLNYNVYCFGADGERRWRLDVGGPVSALVTVPLKQGALVVAGTSKGRLVSIRSDGTIQAVTALDSEILDILPGRESITVATADGQLRSLAAAHD